MLNKDDAEQKVRTARELLLDLLSTHHSSDTPLESQLSELTDVLEEFFKGATPHQAGKCVIHANDLISIYEKFRDAIEALRMFANSNTTSTLENVLNHLNSALGESTTPTNSAKVASGEPQFLRYTSAGVERTITIEDLAKQGILERARILASSVIEFLTESHKTSSEKLGLKKLMGLLPRSERLFMMSSHPAILLVDDDSLIRDAVTRKLSIELPTVNVTTCETGGECLDLLQNVHPTKKLGTPRLVFLDLTMPGLNGLEVLEKIRNIPPIAETLVLVLTAHPDPYFHERAQQIGCSGIVSKSEINTHIKNLGIYLNHFQTIN